MMKKTLLLATLVASCTIFCGCSKGDDDTPDTSVTTHEYVEIGGLRWSTMNLGATTVAGSPATCYGNYYAWGETEPRYTSLHLNGINAATFDGWKSTDTDGYSDSHYPEYKGAKLDAAHDAATAAWGTTWRTPSTDDYQALIAACTDRTTTAEITSLASANPAAGIYWLTAEQTYMAEYTGVAGVLFVAKSDTTKRLFFPAAGLCFDTSFDYGGQLGYYWSSSCTQA